VANRQPGEEKKHFFFAGGGREKKVERGEHCSCGELPFLRSDRSKEKATFSAVLEVEDVKEGEG